MYFRITLTLGKCSWKVRDGILSVDMQRSLSLSLVYFWNTVSTVICQDHKLWGDMPLDRVHGVHRSWGFRPTVPFLHCVSKVPRSAVGVLKAGSYSLRHRSAGLPTDPAGEGKNPHHTRGWGNNVATCWTPFWAGCPPPPCLSNDFFNVYFFYLHFFVEKFLFLFWEYFDLYFIRIRAFILESLFLL